MIEQLMRASNLNEIREAISNPQFDFSKLTEAQGKEISLKFLSGGAVVRELFPIEDVLIDLMGEGEYDAWAEANDIA